MTALFRYIDSIIDSVHWMGHVPTKITHTSDYFEQMFEFAIKLIKKDKAFICHQVTPPPPLRPITPGPLLL